MKKPNCKHAKIPAYEPFEKESAETLNRRIDKGEVDAYPVLTRLAVFVAVDQGRFTRETCPHCTE